MANGINGILTLKQVAARLQVSPTWVYKKCRAGFIPHVKMGGVIRVREKDLEEWMTAHKIDGALKV